MCLLANDRSIVIKKAGKGSYVFIWEPEDYIVEASKQLNDESVYKSVKFKDKILQDLAEKSNGIFKGLKQKGKITEKQLKYFTIEHKKVTNLGKMYLLPKIHKRLFDIPGRPVISNCGTPTEKASEFLDNQLKEVIQNGWSYIKDSNDFIKKIKHLKNIPDNAILVNADVAGLYPSIPHETRLKALKEVLDKREENKISTEDLVKMAEFVFKNNYFEFNGKVKHQISGTAIGTKFAPTYACIFMDEIETKFLETQEFQPLVCFRYIDAVFFIWTHGPDKLVSFTTKFNNYHPNVKFTYESNKENITFLDLDVSLSGNKLTTDLHTKSTENINICIIHRHTQPTLNVPLFTARH